MVLASVEGPKLRRTLLWFALVGVAVAVVLFFGGSLIGTAIRTAQVAQPATATVRITAANDADADGSINPLDAREHPVREAVIELRATGAVARSVETDAVGAAVADGIAAGTYEVAAFVGDEAVSVQPTSITVQAGANADALFALNTSGKTLGAVHGRVVEDSDRDGKIDELDAPAVGAEVQLFSEGEQTATTTTDDQGRYVFGALEPGQYVVLAKVPVDQEARFSSPSALSIAAVVRSQIDRAHVNLLLPLNGLEAQRPSPRLAAALQQTIGVTITKLASDGDELDQEFVRTTPGSDVSYTISLEALGDGSDSYGNVVVTDVVPSGIVIDDVRDGGVAAGQTIRWHVGTMAGGTTLVLGYDAHIDSAAAEGSYRNEATVSADGIDPLDDDSTVLVRTGDLAVAAPTADSATAGTTTAGAGETAGAVSDGSRVEVGVEAWQLALAAAIPVTAVLAVLLVGLRRART